MSNRQNRQICLVDSKRHMPIWLHNYLTHLKRNVDPSDTLISFTMTSLKIQQVNALNLWLALRNTVVSGPDIIFVLGTIK